MIRSHTKGIYKSDDDKACLCDSPSLTATTDLISSKAATKTHGFARLYSTVVKEHFGGRKRHLASVLPLLAPGAQCA